MFQGGYSTRWYRLYAAWLRTLCPRFFRRQLRRRRWGRGEGLFLRAEIVSSLRFCCSSASQSATITVVWLSSFFIRPHLCARFLLYANFFSSVNKFSAGIKCSQCSVQISAVTCFRVPVKEFLAPGPRPLRGLFKYLLPHTSPQSPTLTKKNRYALLLARYLLRKISEDELTTK